MRKEKILEKDTRVAPDPGTPRPDPPGTRLYQEGEKMKCKFEWYGTCTPNECNFVYCEHNPNRRMTVEEKAQGYFHGSTPKANKVEDNE